MPPDWPLIRAIERAVADPRWGGGIHRDHLAALTGLEPYSREFRDALGVCYRMRRVDFCADYVVPGRGSQMPPGAAHARSA